MAAVHALVDGLAAENAHVDTRPLARFLSLTSSWAAPCQYCGSDGGLGVAVFDFVPTTFESIVALTVTDGVVATQRLRPVPHGEHGCCLIWEGDPFQRAYLELADELLELKLETPLFAKKSLLDWFAGLPVERQDAILDGVAPIAQQGSAMLPRSLGQHLSLAREFVVGARRLVISAAFQLQSNLFLAVDDPGEQDWALRVSPLGENDRVCDIGLVASAGSNHGRPAVYRTNLHLDLDAPGSCSLVRVTLAISDLATSHWIPVRGLETSLSRRRIKNLVDWERADEDFVRDFANASINVEADERCVSPAEIVLSPGASPVDAAIFICRYADDVFALRSTLIALRLTAGDDIMVRLISHRGPTSQEVLELRTLCQTVGLAVSLFVLGDGVPFSDALHTVSGEPRRRAIILADSGVVPLDRDWWHRLSGILAHDPGLLYYAVAEGQSGIEPSSLSYFSGTSPLLVAGPSIVAGVLHPAFELQTFEGVLHHALATAARAGRAERLEGGRLMPVRREQKHSSFGPARLDEAVIAAALGAQKRGIAVPRNNLVHLPPRAGAG